MMTSKEYSSNLKLSTMKNLLIIFAIFFSNCSLSLTCSSISDGDWNNPLTWSCGAIPSPGDTITISLGDIVTVSSNINLNGVATLIYIDGVLLFDSPGAKLRLGCGSSIVLSATGEIRDSGNGTPSHSIRICGSDVWTGSTGSVFGPLVIGTIPLSIELIDFTVDVFRNELLFQWSTANEINNDYFNIESSIDNLNWVSIGTIKGAGSSSERIDYEFGLNNNLAHRYFRLRQTDFDGQSTLSKVVSISNSASYDINVYPNPMNSNYVIIETDIEEYDMKILSLNGKVVYQLQNQNEKYLRIDGLNIEKGTYIIHLFGENQKMTAKIIKD